MDIKLFKVLICGIGKYSTVPQIAEKDYNVRQIEVGTIQTRRKLQKWTANYPNVICVIGKLFQLGSANCGEDSNVRQIE